MVYQENTNTEYRFGISVPIFLVFSWYFIGIMCTVFLKFGKLMVFFGKIKIGLVFGFRGCYFIGIGLVLVCHFPETGISNADTIRGLGSRIRRDLLPNCEAGSMIPVDISTNSKSMIRTDPGSRSLGSDPGIRFRDPRTCLSLLPCFEKEITKPSDFFL